MFGAESPEISQASYLLGYRVMSYLLLVVGSMMVGMHIVLSSQRITARFGMVLLAAFGSLPVWFVFSRMMWRSHIPMETFLLIVLSFGLFAYVIVAEIFLRWGAEWLNRHRVTWVKELEYVYVVLGLSGLVVSINRIEVMDGRFDGLDLVGPLVVMFAVAIKFVKIRAEVAGWDTNGFWAKEEEERRVDAERMRELEEGIEGIKERTRSIMENDRIAEKEHKAKMKELRAKLRE
jgi:hypothetical protein